MTELERSRAARVVAEAALVSVAYHYGSRPEFVLLGGLVPELLCSTSQWQHAGTTDVDVQVDLEIAAGSVNAPRLEQALIAAGFRADNEHVWRWITKAPGTPAIVKFELLADQDDIPDSTTVRFDGCTALGAANLRGTGFAARDIELRTLTSPVNGTPRTVGINVTGTAGFLLAKIAAARTRRANKDWYDIAFVLLHNDLGGHTQATQAIINRFGAQLRGDIASAIADLKANFANPADQGPTAYAEQMHIDHPNSDPTHLAADAVIAVTAMCTQLQHHP